MVDTNTLSKAKQSFTSKFAPKRDGPHVIHRVVKPTSFEVSSIENPDVPLGKYYISALTPYHGKKTKLHYTHYDVVGDLQKVDKLMLFKLVLPVLTRRSTTFDLHRDATEMLDPARDVRMIQRGRL